VHAARSTTRTMEQRQIAEVNARLRSTTLPAAEVGVGPPAALGGAVLVGVHYEGSPIFGYVWGRLRPAGAGAAGPADRVPLHTPHLRAISRELRLAHHHWGV